MLKVSIANVIYYMLQLNVFERKTSIPRHLLNTYTITYGHTTKVAFI